jgi:hypothetical protein
MDKALIYPSAIIGIIFLACYLFQCAKKKNEVQTNAMIGLFMSGPSLVAGAYLVASPFSPQVTQSLSELPLYIFIAGMALIAHTAKNLWDQLK